MGGEQGWQNGQLPPPPEIRAICVWSESGGSIHMENQLKNGPPLLDQNPGKTHPLLPQTESVHTPPPTRIQLFEVIFRLLNPATDRHLWLLFGSFFKPILRKYSTLHEFVCHPCVWAMLIFPASFPF